MNQSTQANPLSSTSGSGSLFPQSCTLVIFGGAGDLSRRKLLPAIYNLGLDAVLPTNFAVMGFSLEDLSDDSYRDFARSRIEEFSRQTLTEAQWADYERTVFYQRGTFDDPESYQALKRRLEEVEPLWNVKHIDHVQITVAEQEGVGTRAGYYEGAGALRDMVQNHILQLLSLMAMEPPWSMDADVIRDRRLDVLHCLRPLSRRVVEDCVVRAQYAPGYFQGEDVPGYRREAGVAPDSVIETYVALKLFIDNWRWAGVPFYIRTGKRLPKRASEIAVQFKPVPHILFNTDMSRPLEPDVLALSIQPNEGLSLRIATKLPGPRVRIYPVKMDFRYGSTFGGQSPEAYERLLLDVMAGDATLFMRRDAVEASWAWIQTILDEWEDSRALAAGILGRHLGSRGGGPADRIRPIPMAGDMTGPTTPDVQDNAPVPVSVREIESQLDSAWENMQREAVKIGAAVTRASMSNVIIVCDHRDQIEDLTESIALLVVRHPARVLLLAAGADRGQPVLAEVYAHCRRLGDGIQLCCEHILVEFYVEDVDRVASVVRPLLIGDLPTALWWAGAGTPTSTGALFDTLADLGTCGQPDG